MNNELLNRIDTLIENDYAELVRDIVHLVNIKSVREESIPGAPFGAGPRKVLDEVLHIGQERGFCVQDYGVGVISLSLKDAPIDLGIWTHGDVVPEGRDWLYTPYDATEHRGCVIGRGSTDNKGQLVSILHLLTIFQKIGVQLNYNPALYVGSCEETGMLDLKGVNGNPDAKGFLNTCTPPRLSLVPDGSFPIAYCGKGAAVIEIEGIEALNGLSIEAGRDETPGLAEAVLDCKDCPEIPNFTIERGPQIKLSVETPPRHAAYPDPKGNMITLMTRALIDNHLCAPKDVAALSFINQISCDISGKIFGINHHDPDTMDTTVASVYLATVKGYLHMKLNIRYPLGVTYEELVIAIRNTCEKHGFIVTASQDIVRPYKNDPTGEILVQLREISNNITGIEKKAYNVSGGAYSHLLPNAYLFGMDGNLPPDDLPKGHGGAHGKDEAVSIARLQRAMRIYARSLLALNEMKW